MHKMIRMQDLRSIIYENQQQREAIKMKTEFQEILEIPDFFSLIEPRIITSKPK